MSLYAILDGHDVVPHEGRLEGDPAFMKQWAAMMEDIDGRRVARTELPDDVVVSTVFLGIDYGLGGTPLWFETMVFGGEFDQEMHRYATWAQAEAGHVAMLARVRR